MKSSWWQLLVVFAPLSLLSFGGGQSILADIQHQTVTVHHWLTQDQFLDDYAIARASAGPSTMLIVTLVGWQVAGVVGAALTTFAIFLPSSILFFSVAALWRRHTFNRWRDRLARGLAPISVGLVMASTYSLLIANGRDALAWIVTGASTLVLLRTEIHPLLLLLCGAGAFMLRTAVGA